MAKRKKKGGFNFSQIGGVMEKLAEKTEIYVEEDFDLSNDYLGTGSHILNAAISTSVYGGIKNTGITMIAGENGTGKSFIAINIAKAAQDKGYGVVYIDTEHAQENSDFPLRGIDPDPERFKLLRVNKIEKLRNFLAALLDDLKKKHEEYEEIPKMVIIIDSVAQMSSIKEIEDAITNTDKQDMTRAKALTSMMRIINNDLGILRIPLFMTNHIYYTQDFMPKMKIKGGEGLMYTCSTIITLTNAKDKSTSKKGDDYDIGYGGKIITAKTIKNRLAQPAKVKFTIDFVEGLNPYRGLEFFCTKKNYDKVGIFQGTVTANEDGEEVLKEGGHMYYVRHLDRKIHAKDMFRPEVFNKDVLDGIDEICKSYFQYGTEDISDERDRDLISDAQNLIQDDSLKILDD